jgi:hypothetical protein
MMELMVTMDFACRWCEHTVTVRVKCEGPGLAAGMRSVVAANVPCPTCGHTHRVYFEPNGTIREVTTYRETRPVPVPSEN